MREVVLESQMHFQAQLTAFASKEEFAKAEFRGTSCWTSTDPLKAVSEKVGGRKRD